jgi:hypothetical protein
MKRILTVILVIVVYDLSVAEKYIPSSISYSILEGQHTYRISGLHPSKKDQEFKYADALTKSIEGCIEAKIDKDKDQLILVCKNELIDLEKEMNLLMGYGIFPGWDELVIRDKRSINYDAKIYCKVMETQLSETNTGIIMKHEINEDGSVGLFLHKGIWGSEFYDTLSEFTLRYTDQGYTLLDEIIEHVILINERLELLNNNYDTAKFDSVIVQYNKTSSGMLILTPFTDYCMCHSWYAMRLFTDNGEYIWEDPVSLCGFIKIIPYDMDNDGVEELIVFSSAHLNRRVLVYDDDTKK